jgi:hypothetical protein
LVFKNTQGIKKENCSEKKKNNFPFDDKQFSKTIVLKKYSTLIIIKLGVMILQALLNVYLTLLNTLSYMINFPLESSHGRHKLSKSSFNCEGMRY